LFAKILHKGILALILLAPSLHAHESRPVYLEINEVQPEIFQTVWKIPAGGIMRGELYPVLPSNCQIKTTGGANYSHALIRKQHMSCPGGLAGKTVSINDMELNLGISALVRVKFLSGETHSKILLNREPAFVIPEKESKWGVIESYTKLGIQHIWLGFDHLLFVFCLLLMISSRKLLFWTITGFTVAHSITLALSVLNLVRLPSAVVETCIALSIVFLAAEIARGNKRSLAYRKPFVVSSVFGLLHGFGFADVLVDLGLPQTELGLGLLFFNVGVEIGQITFIGVLLFVALFWRETKERLKLEIPSSLSLENTLTPVIGSLAAFWVFERLSSF